MSVYTQRINQLEAIFNQIEQTRERIKELSDQMSEMQRQYIVMLEAQQLLTAVSDENTTKVLDYICGVINQTLGELFPHDNRRIYLEKTMYQGQHAHINIKLTGTNGKTRDLTLQTGTGLRQVISFLFILCLIEIRKGRRLLIADELLSGMHPTAKACVMDIISLFAADGFQFAMVEYGADTVGKIYLVEKPDQVAKVTPLGSNKYNNEVFVFNRPPETVDMSIFVDESVTDEVSEGV